MTYLFHPLNEEIYALPISIGIRHIRHEPKLFLPHSKMVYPLRRDDVLRSIAPKELVQ